MPFLVIALNHNEDDSCVSTRSHGVVSLAYHLSPVVLEEKISHIQETTLVHPPVSALDALVIVPNLDKQSGIDIFPLPSLCLYLSNFQVLPNID